jgi:hypothetical protein
VRFCDGIPERATRAVSANERLALRIASGRAIRKAGLALAGVAAPVLAVPAVFLGAVAIGVDPEGAVLVLPLLALVALLGGLPVAILFARDAIGAARALRRDVARGEVVVFGAGADERAVLAESLHLVGRAGEVVAPVRRAAVGEAAPPPPAPPTWALSAAEVPAPLAGATWVKRALSPDERAELDRHARRVGRISPVLIVVSVVLAAGAAASLSSGQSGPRLLADLAVVPLLALQWVRVVRDRRAAARLRADADDGWAYRGAAAEGDAAVEVLPASRAYWTWGGAPAEWRLRHHA